MSTILEDVDEYVLVEGSTYQFKVVAKKNGVVWDITSATVTFYLKGPDGVTTEHNGTVLDGPNGIAYFNCVASDLSNGDWKRQWKIVVGPIVQKSIPKLFSVTVL